jgi:hypothetical protein
VRISLDTFHHHFFPPVSIALSFVSPTPNVVGLLLDRGSDYCRPRCVYIYVTGVQEFGIVDVLGFAFLDPPSPTLLVEALQELYVSSSEGIDTAPSGLSVLILRHVTTADVGFCAAYCFCGNGGSCSAFIAAL